MRRPGALSLAVLFLGVADCALAQRPVVVPPPRGMLSDFANVVPAAQAAEIERIARYVRERSGGEIAVVTLRDIGGRDVGDVALNIGRDWKVGAKAEIGDERRNAGVVVLVVPRETSSDGLGHISIQTGQGVEGFIPDAVAGRIRREGTELFRLGDYGGGLLLITQRLAERYAANFAFSLDSLGMPQETPIRVPEGRSGPSPLAALLIFFVIVFLLTRVGARSGCLWFAVGHELGRRRRRRRGWYGGDGGSLGGFGGFGGFGGGGGGFGGFGGGGGFSGGGSSGSW